jgi:hypothetical protein
MLPPAEGRLRKPALLLCGVVRRLEILVQASHRRDLMITIKDVGNVILYLGGLCLALGAIGVVLRFAVVRPLKSLIDDRIEAVQASTKAVQETADQVHAEVSPDHGHSMKDTINRTEIKLDALTQRFEDHLRTHGITP